MTTNTVSNPPRHHEPALKANELCTQFTNRCKTMNLPIETQTMLEQLEHNRLISIENAKHVVSCADTPIVMHELLEALSNRKDTAPGIDKVTYSMIHHAPSNIKQRLIHIYNKILSTGRMPQCWKVAEIIAIPKPGQTEAYRPISLLPVISKIFERIILKRLQYVCRPLHTNTMGFKKKQGTTDAIATFINDMTKNKRNCKHDHAVAVYIDLEKAFELANKNVVLSEIVRAGVKGNILKVLSDYLTDRRAVVAFQGCTSNRTTFENGTPQGSTLSPTLFNMLIDRLVTTDMPKGIKVIAYADDLIMYTVNIKRGNSVTLAQRGLNKLYEVATTLGLTFSESKTKAMYFNSGNDPNVHLVINDQPIEWTRCYKYLGVMINKRLDIRDHIEYTIEKANRKINALKVLATCSGVNANVLRLIFCSTIQPTLVYGIHFSNISNECHIKDLNKIQNSALRIISRFSQWTHVHSMRY